jgi:hypothetical protein
MLRPCCTALVRVQTQAVSNLSMLLCASSHGLRRRGQRQIKRSESKVNNRGMSYFYKLTTPIRLFTLSKTTINPSTAARDPETACSSAAALPWDRSCDRQRPGTRSGDLRLQCIRGPRHRITTNLSRVCAAQQNKDGSNLHASQFHGFDRSQRRRRAAEALASCDPSSPTPPTKGHPRRTHTSSIFKYLSF